MQTNPLPPRAVHKAPRPLFEFDLRLEPGLLVRWIICVTVVLVGGWLLLQQATPFPTDPPAFSTLLIIALGFAAFCLLPDADLDS